MRAASVVVRRARAARGPGWWIVAALGACFAIGLTSGAAMAAGPGLCRDPAVDALVGQAAQAALDADALLALSRRFDAPTPPDCDKTVSYCLGRQVALAEVERAYALLGATPPNLDGAAKLLEEGHRHGEPWQLLVALGDVQSSQAHQSKDPALYRDAAQNLQAALNSINEPALCASFGELTPPPADVARIRKRAQEAVMLSPRFELARTRSGDCGGIFVDLGKVRGIDVEAVPVPITFVYDRADFTAEGQKAADALLACLREKAVPSIVLTGHTDLHGSDPYNMDLSARRLAVVAALLKTGGYAGSVRLIPMGKREPFRPDDPTQHSADEIDQMNRRVELRETKP